jgi:excisionase family DNA binding protein
MTRSGYGSLTAALLSSREEPDMPPTGSLVHRQKDTSHMAQTDDFDAPEALLTPSEVAALFRVNPKTVTRWARAGKLTAIRTLGGHRRFRVSEIRRCLEEMSREEA